MTRRGLSQVAPGDRLGPVVVSVDRPRLIAYAAASGDHNRIHWDERFARSVGLPDVIAHGMWTMGAAVELVSAWAGDPAAVVRYATRFTAPVVVPIDTEVQVEVSGTVARVEDARAVVDLTVTAGGQKVLTRAQAVVALAGAKTAADA